VSRINFLGDFLQSIDGRLVDAETSIRVINPADESLVGLAPDCSEAQLDAAVRAARRAFPTWKATSLKERADALRRIADRIAESVEPLGLLLTREHGKPLGDARAEISSAARWIASVADADLPVGRRQEPGGRLAEIHRVPLGVVAAIPAWNAPITLAAWKLAPALLTGNTLILKPSPHAPLTTLKIAELVLDLLPPGVLNTISGGNHLGPLLSAHPDINKVSFTGSTPTGRAVMRDAASTLKRITLELGGNDAAIVMPDVDVDDVAERIFWAAFRNAGQVCVAAKRVYVHDEIYDRFAAKMVALAHANPPGNGEQPQTRIGPLQNKLQYERVKAMIEEARTTGLKFLAEPGDLTGPGYFIAPTIIDNPPDDSPVVREEPFGPLLPLLRFHDVDEVITRANDSDYALAGSVWSGDRDKALEMGRRLEAGTVWVNTIHGMSPSLPFGGHKQSGFGVENSDEGLLEYTNIQVLITSA
jgi:acyl-CoA reductase-like NAD-dependent aldehyde dehydrogenase